MAEKSKKKIEEKENAPDNEAVPDKIGVAPVKEDKVNQKAISKKVEITRFLKRQGLGQNAIQQAFVLFGELRKLECEKECKH